MSSITGGTKRKTDDESNMNENVHLLHRLLSDSQFRLYFDRYLTDRDAVAVLSIDRGLARLFITAPYYCKYLFIYTPLLPQVRADFSFPGSVVSVLLPANNPDLAHVFEAANRYMQPIAHVFPRGMVLTEVSDECMPFTRSTEIYGERIRFVLNHIKEYVRVVGHKQIRLDSALLNLLTEFTNIDGSWSHPLILVNGQRRSGKSWMIHNLMRNMKDLFTRVYLVGSIPIPEDHGPVPYLNVQGIIVMDATLLSIQTIAAERLQHPDGNWLVVMDQLERIDQAKRCILDFKSKNITVICASQSIKQIPESLCLNCDVFLQLTERSSRAVEEIHKKAFPQISLELMHSHMDMHCTQYGRALVSSTRASHLYASPIDYSAPFQFSQISPINLP